MTGQKRKPAKKAAAKNPAPKKATEVDPSQLVPGDRVWMDGDVHLVESVKVLDHIAYASLATQNTRTGYRSTSMIAASASVKLADKAHG